MPCLLLNLCIADTSSCRWKTLQECKCLDCTYEEKKNGTVYYPIYHFEPDLANPVALDDDTIETMRVMAQQISQENESVERSYQNALRKRNLTDEAADAIDGVAYEPLDNDLADAE